jgi:hypothetical protein
VEYRGDSPRPGDFGLSLHNSRDSGEHFRTKARAVIGEPLSCVITRDRRGVRLSAEMTSIMTYPSR